MQRLGEWLDEKKLDRKALKHLRKNFESYNQYQASLSRAMAAGAERTAESGSCGGLAKGEHCLDSSAVLPAPALPTSTAELPVSPTNAAGPNEAPAAAAASAAPAATLDPRAGMSRETPAGAAPGLGFGGVCVEPGVAAVGPGGGSGGSDSVGASGPGERGPCTPPTPAAALIPAETSDAPESAAATAVYGGTPAESKEADAESGLTRPPAVVPSVAGTAADVAVPVAAAGPADSGVATLCAGRADGAAGADAAGFADSQAGGSQSTADFGERRAATAAVGPTNAPSTAQAASSGPTRSAAPVSFQTGAGSPSPGGLGDGNRSGAPLAGSGFHASDGGSGAVSGGRAASVESGPGYAPIPPAAGVVVNPSPNGGKGLSWGVLEGSGLSKEGATGPAIAAATAGVPGSPAADGVDGAGEDLGGCERAPSQKREGRSANLDEVIHRSGKL